MVYFDCLLPQASTKLRLVMRELMERSMICEIVVLNGLRSITINVSMTDPPTVKRNHIVISGCTYSRLRETEAYTKANDP